MSIKGLLYSLFTDLLLSLEYEAGTRDIAELRWHLKVNNHQMQKVRTGLEWAEAQNRQLLKEIDFIKKQGPRVQEKLRLEERNTRQIESARAEVRTAPTYRFMRF